MARSHLFTPARIRLELSPVPACLPGVVALVTQFCEQLTADPAILYAFELAANELIENVVKYGEGTSACVAIEHRVWDYGRELRLSTENVASPEHLRNADQRLAALIETQDPMGHLDSLVRQSLVAQGGSMLGLGRLRAESALQLSHRVKGNTLSITAWLPLALTPTGEDSHAGTPNPSP